MYLLLTLGAAVSFALGGVCMKSSAGMTRLGPTLLFYLLFAAGATLQSLAMRKTELGVTYLSVLGMESAVAFGCGWWFFAEGCSWWKVAGVVTILTGILLLHLDAGSSTDTTEEKLASPLKISESIASDNPL
jgi:multidrug transporter EmrE-like cation transporter